MHQLQQRLGFEEVVLVAFEEGGGEAKREIRWRDATESKDRSLQRLNRFSLWTFLALTYSELNCLAVSQRFEAVSFDSTEVYKHVRTIFLLNKTKTFGLVKKFNLTGNTIRHKSSS